VYYIGLIQWSAAACTACPMELNSRKYANHEWKFHFHPCLSEEFLPPVLSDPLLSLLLAVTKQLHSCQTQHYSVTDTEDSVPICQTKLYVILWTY